MKRQITALAACALLALGFTTVSAATTAAALPPASVSATADTAGIDAYSDTTDTATAIIPQSTTYSVSMDSDSMEEMVASVPLREAIPEAGMSTLPWLGGAS